MQGWTLEYVQSLTISTYTALVEWINEEASKAHGDGSVDMDAVMQAKAAKAPDE